MHISPPRLTRPEGPRFPVNAWVFPFFIGVLAALLELSGDAGRLHLRFDRDEIAIGEWWRLASGHFVHLGWQHLALNLTGLLLVWLLVGRAFGGRQWSVIGVALVIGTSGGLWWLSPQVGWYVGLSGLLHGLLVAGLVGRIRAAPVESGVLLLAVAVKLATEQWSGPLPGSEVSAGGPVVVDAHLYGAISGVFAGLPRAIRDFRPAAI